MAREGVRFRPLHVELEVGARPLAAYQVELVAAEGDAEIVGVEGGHSAGFDQPPYYDPEALAGGRIVLGAELKRFAGLDGQALFVGLGRSFQIWNPEAYAERKQSMRDKARANFHRLPWGRKAAPA